MIFRHEYKGLTFQDQKAETIGMTHFINGSEQFYSKNLPYFQSTMFVGPIPRPTNFLFTPVTQIPASLVRVTGAYRKFEF